MARRADPHRPSPLPGYPARRIGRIDESQSNRDASEPAHPAAHPAPRPRPTPAGPELRRHKRGLANLNFEPVQPQRRLPVPSSASESASLTNLSVRLSHATAELFILLLGLARATSSPSSQMVWNTRALTRIIRWIGVDSTTSSVAESSENQNEIQGSISHWKCKMASSSKMIA